MEPVTTFATALGAIRTTVELVTAYKKRKNKLDPETEKLLSEIESRLFSLQKEVLQLKEREVALVEENAKLRGQIRSHEEGAANWEQYKRKQLGGTTVLVRDDEPGTYYCLACRERENKPIPFAPLGRVLRASGYTHQCSNPNCGSMVTLL